MAEFFITIPLLLALLVLVLGIVRSIAAAWFNYRVKLRLLEKLEKNPELVNSPAEVQDLYSQLAPVPDVGGAPDYTIVGTVLALIGAGCLVVGRLLRYGQLAAGIYWGGMICIFLGVGLAMLGLLIRFIGRTMTPRSKGP